MFRCVFSRLLTLFGRQDVFCHLPVAFSDLPIVLSDLLLVFGDVSFVDKEMVGLHLLEIRHEHGGFLQSDDLLLEVPLELSIASRVIEFVFQRWLEKSNLN